MTGLINLDFADVKSVMQNAGTALMAVGEGHGDGRAVAAARAAITSPLLDVSIDGATGVLLNVSGGPDLTLAEVTEAAETIQAAVDPDANIFFGAVIHPRIQDNVRVTVIATGLKEGGRATARESPRPAIAPPPPARDPEPRSRLSEPAPREREPRRWTPNARDAQHQPSGSAAAPFRPAPRPPARRRRRRLRSPRLPPPPKEIKSSIRRSALTTSRLGVGRVKLGAVRVGSRCSRRRFRGLRNKCLARAVDRSAAATERRRNPVEGAGSGQGQMCRRAGRHPAASTPAPFTGLGGLTGNPG